MTSSSDITSTGQEKQKLLVKSAPEDHGKKILYIFYLWGCGVLMPFNAIASAFDFFANEMPGYNPSVTYPFAINSFLVVIQLVMIVKGHLFSDRFKVQLAFVIGAITFIILPLVAHFIDDPDTSYWLCFFILMFFGAVNGMVQGQVFALASCLPFEYVGAVMVGNGAAGITMNGLRVVLTAVLPGKDNLFLNAMIFFSLACICLLTCAYCFDIVNNSEFYKYYKQKGS